MAQQSEQRKIRYAELTGTTMNYQNTKYNIVKEAKKLEKKKLLVHRKDIVSRPSKQQVAMQYKSALLNYYVDSTNFSKNGQMDQQISQFINQYNISNKLHLKENLKAESPKRQMVFGKKVVDDNYFSSKQPHKSKLAASLKIPDNMRSTQFNNKSLQLDSSLVFRPQSSVQTLKQFRSNSVSNSCDQLHQHKDIISSQLNNSDLTLRRQMSRSTSQGILRKGKLQNQYLSCSLLQQPNNDTLDVISYDFSQQI